jgi:hypothetical protein
MVAFQTSGSISEDPSVTFDLIRFELIVGPRVFPKDMNHNEVRERCIGVAHHSPTFFSVSRKYDSKSVCLSKQLNVAELPTPP